MTKTIFVVGCSYSHHDKYVEPTQTWPCLLQNDLNCKVINCSVPGNSNLSYFYRLKELQYQFGKPDKVIVQLTGLSRAYLHQKNVPICDMIKSKENDYYYDKYDECYRDAGVPITPAIIDTPHRMDALYDHYKFTRKQLATYFRKFTSDDTEMWLNLKEILLIDLYFKDVTFFSWNTQYSYITNDVFWANECNINYIGSINGMINTKEFNSYSHIPGQDDHFNAAGHYAVKELIKRHV
jgi:hypothetical protein